MLSNKIFIVSIYILFVISGWLCVYAGANDDIMTMNLSSQEDLNKLDSYLSGDNVLAFLKTREKLLTYPYEGLKEIRNKIEKWDSGRKLKALVDELMFNMDNDLIINVIEDIFINNVPQSLSAPFYGGSASNRNVRELKPNAERLYENNWNFKYSKSELLMKNSMLWINPGYVAEEFPSNPVQNNTDSGIELLDHNNEVVPMWNYRLKLDNLKDWFIKVTDLRQWVKRYEENPLFPVIYKNMVILRNEYRVFCLDIKTSETIWSIGNLDKSFHETYVSFRHPHQNSAGYEILVSNDTLFTELDHKFIALSLNNMIKPEISWQKDLGEFTLCAKPILNRKVLILPIVNARGEIFICGLSVSNGELKWSTYVGTSSFLSPVCSISCVNGKEVVFGTNHGVIISMNSDDGSIAWIRKYAPKQYNIVKYWDKSCFKAFSTDKCPIEYDTEFIQPAGRNLYYKPRESDYFYMIDSRTGELKKQVLVDPGKFYILCVAQDKAVFLKKPKGPEDKASLSVVDLNSGKNIYDSEIDGDYLSGVTYLNEGIILFKFGGIIYLLKISGNSIELKKAGRNIIGWLVNSTGNNLFIADKNTLFKFDVDFFKSLENTSGGSIKEQRDLLLNVFKEALSLSPGDAKIPELKNRILSLLNQISIFPDELMPPIIENIVKLKDPYWNDLVANLFEKYGDEIVRYDGINLRLGGFLYGTGLVKYNYKDKPVQTRKSETKPARQYEIYGQAISPLPITVLKGDSELDFYLMKWFDQIVCVDESGGIKWFRKTFKASCAFLYENILIIKDKKNVLGVDAHSGKYLWSFSVDWDNVSGLDKPLLRFGIRFIDGNIILVFSNKIWSLDISTGYSKKSLDTGYDFIRSMYIYADDIYIVSSLNEISIYDKNINFKGKIPLDFLGANNNEQHNINFIDGFMVLSVKADAYVIDLKKRKLSGKFSFGNKSKYLLDTYKNNLLLIVPSKSVTSYRVSRGSLALNWEHNFKDQDGQLWGFGLEKTDFRIGREAYDPYNEKYYFIFSDKIYLPCHSVAGYLIAELDLRDGKEEQPVYLAGVGGIFDNISKVEEHSGRVNFVISTKCSIKPPDNYAEYLEDYIVDIKPKLIRLDLYKRNILKIVDFSLDYKYTDYVKPVIIQTKNCFIYGIRDQKIISEEK